MDSSERIDEMNKKMRVIRHHLDRMISTEKEEKSVTSETAELVRQSYEYRTLEQECAKEREVLKEMQQKEKS